LFELTLSILCHTALGVALATIVWTVGGGCLVLLRPRIALPAVCAYPLGLFAVLAACTLFLTERWFAVLAAGLLAAPLVAVWRERAAALRIAHTVARAVAWAAPAIVGLATTLGFFLHGPTAKVDSNAFGDVVWYAAKISSARESLFPLRDLSALGVNLWRAELGPSLVGATVSYLPGFDPFLFQTSALPAFLGVSLCCGLALIPLPDSAPRLRLSLLAVGMVAYASWLAESPPVALALPLAFSIYVLAFGTLPKRAFAALLVVLALDVVLTKGLLLIPLAILAGFAMRRFELDRRQRLAVMVGVPLLACALLAATLANSWWVVKAASLHFRPVTIYRGLEAQVHTRSTIQLAPALQLAGYAALGVMLVRARATALLVALAVCLVWSWTILEYSVEIGLGVVVLLSVLELGRRSTVDRVPLTVAAVCLALGAWYRDFAGIRAALVECALLAAIVLSALAARSRPAGFHLRLYASVGAVVLLGLSGHALAGGIATLALAGAVAVVRIPERVVSVAVLGLLIFTAVGAVAAQRSDDLRLGTYDTSILPSDAYEVWHRVGKVVPRDGLVFTDQTGPSVTAATGQNYYPAVAGRQVYLAGWYQSRLREDDRDRVRRLRLNRLVLQGRVTPASVAPPGGYRSYYEVVARGGWHPEGARRLYANRRFVLYRIPG
jgi:hypothetical protein